MIRVALFGAGRMSAAIVRAAAADADMEVADLIAPHAPDWATTARYRASLDLLDETPDLLLDFSLPAGTAVAADWCRRSGVALLSGVTGLDQAARDGLARAAQDVAVLWSPNYSLGVNLLAQLCQRAAAVLGRDAHVLVEDIHHQWKKDMPSGTALMLGAAMQDVRSPAATEPEYRSRREGEVIGQHSVTFEWAGEKLLLSHAALDRDVFARGALAAARWLSGQECGLYSAADWLAAE